MNCPYCQKEETNVIESRVLSGGDGVRRRRRCIKCNKRFTTHERVVNVDLKILKKNGRTEQYDREKLVRGLAKACYKRGIGQSVIEDAVDKIEVNLMSRDDLTIRSSEVGKLVLNALKKIDRLAHLRFASVYLDFDSFDSFKKYILEKLDIKN